MNLYEKLNEIYQQPPKSKFLFDVGQVVRVIKTLDTNTHFIQNLLGTKGKIVERWVTGMHKENWYKVEFYNGQREPFHEEELDYRFIKKSNK